MDGRRLVELREAADLTQVQLAVAADIDPSMVSRIERGVVRNPAVSTVQALARALRCSVDDLLAESTPTPVAKAVGE
jgi:transcriptional regulator with XRE-family HTH domain